MNSSGRKAIGLVVGLLTVAASTFYSSTPASADSCTISTPNVHISTHSGYTRMNFVPSVTCATPAKKLLDLNASVQVWDGDSWVSNSGWTMSELDASSTYVRYSLSKPCSAFTAKYRGRARKNVDGVWSAWKYSNATALSCPDSDGGGGGGGGGSWSVPMDPE